MYVGAPMIMVCSLLWYLPNLGATMRRMCILIYMILAHMGTFTIEQPSTSLLFRHPRFQQIVGLVKVAWRSLYTEVIVSNSEGIPRERMQQTRFLWFLLERNIYILFTSWLNLVYIAGDLYRKGRPLSRQPHMEKYMYKDKDIYIYMIHVKR